jgi:hypothetical protein
MRIKRDNGQEYCTNCGDPWIAGEDHFCKSCFCPAIYCTIIDDFATYQSCLFESLIGGPFSAGVIADMKRLVEEQISRAVPPLTLEGLFKNQPLAKELFKTN